MHAQLVEAREKGADCRERTRALDVLTEGDRVVGVKAQTQGEEPQEIRSKVVEITFAD